MKEILKSLRLKLGWVTSWWGLGVLAIVGLVLFNYFSSVNRVEREKTTAAATEASLDLPREYTIKEGDSLWKIAEAVYGSGYNWVDIVSANKTVLKNPDKLFLGVKITLPEIEPKMVEEYTVQKGDSLWKIGVKICNNGYVWTRVARDNSIRNPNLIEIGQKLTVNCGQGKISWAARD